MSSGTSIDRLRDLAPGRDGLGDARSDTRQALPLPPLVLDLDPHIATDGMGWELALVALRARPAAILELVRAARAGADVLERDVCRLDGVSLDGLPLPAPLAFALRRAEEEGRPVILLTRDHPGLAAGLRNAHPVISDVVEVDPDRRVADLASAAALRLRCPTGFVVLPGPDEGALWARTAQVYRVPGDPAQVASKPPVVRLWARALRLHQWIKNGLVFVPLVLAGRALDPASWSLAAVGFLAFGLVASATYLLNDLHDLPHDRAHRSKRHRPLASGAIRIPHAACAAALGLAAGAGLATLGGPAGCCALAAYLALTLLYTLALKRHVIVDTVALAALFTLRLAAGIAFCDVPGSVWLFMFSMSVFTSLALAKRFVEIEQLAPSRLTGAAGRGYTDRDGPAVLALGAATSMAAVLVFSLYILDAAARHAFYVHPDLLWITPAALFIWLGRIWILCGRGALQDDPVEFALRDKVSWRLGGAVLASFSLACLRF